MRADAGERGQALPLVAVYLSVLVLAAVGFADLGRIYLIQARLQNAAERAAEAGASVAGDLYAERVREAFNSRGTTELSPPDWQAIFDAPRVRDAAVEIVRANLPGVALERIEVRNPDDLATTLTVVAGPRPEIRVEVTLEAHARLFFAAAFGRQLAVLRVVARAAYPL